MKTKLKLLLAVLGLIFAAGLILAAFWLEGRIPDSLGGLMCGLAGALGGVSATALIMEHISHHYTPEQRKELERGETDERNVAIREKAAMTSWYWSLYLLWALFVVCLILNHGIYTALTSVVITLHCVFYLVNMRRWAKKM